MTPAAPKERPVDSLDRQIDQFLAAPSYAVVGASDKTHKYGHKVYRNYLAHQKKVYPVNPKVETVMGNPAFPDLLALPEKVESVSIITPPAVTEKVVDDAIKAGVKNIWMQPGAESAVAVKKAEAAGINVIHGGPCILVVMGYKE
jgi:predicted CoA-binding protein